ncbi:SusC/RagA family TonB-linked outer membrane protein [Lutibacter agarilyticus]|nr:SusC/RagA family TonB-linked outer membrane protein [Lutibacter agarilyticus]
MKKYIKDKILFLGLLTIFCFATMATAQQMGTGISATIVDEQGKPLSGVQIFAPKGISTTTNAKGEFTLAKVSLDQSIIIEMDGYNTQLINSSDLIGEVTLKKSLFLASDKDIVKQAIKTITKREMTGAFSSVNTSDRIVYDNTQYVRDYIEGLMVGVKGTSSVRGIGTALFVIDGVIGRDPNILNMDEVDQITVLKDASAIALYGSQAKNGVIIINTKRGAINKRSATVNIRSGLKTPIELPNYLGAVDYMQLFNEARRNDGLEVFYEQSLIDDYKSSTNPYLYPDVDFYNDEGYLRGATTTTDIVTQFAGGNDKTQYYINMGWNYDQNQVLLNSEANKGSNRFNVRANVDFKVNDWIKSSVDVVAIINSNKTANENLLSSGTTFKPNAYAPFLPLSMMDRSNNSLNAIIEGANVFNGSLLGTTQALRNNTPVAEILAGGRKNKITNTTQFNNAIDLDLSMITKGLSAKTYLSFDFLDVYTESLQNQYRVYEPTWEDGQIVDLTPYGEVDLKDQTQNVNSNSFVSRLGFYGLLNYEKTFKNKHSINTTILGYTFTEQEDDVLQADKYSHLALQISYDYKKKIFADFGATYANSIKLAEGNRGGLSPTVSLAYIISEESFMKNVGFINYLKLKASGGIIKSDIDIDEYYLYDENYSDGATFTWADGVFNREKDISQGQNLSIDYEDRIDLNFGLEANLFNSLWLEFNYFKTDFDNQVTRLSNRYPNYYNIFRPYDNFNKDAYHGFELGLNYAKNFDSGFSFNLGGNILYSQSEVKTRDEVVEYDYLSRIGRPTNAIFGLVDDGFYSENDFNTNTNGDLVLNDNLPVPAFGAVQPGDLKYVDQNNDAIIDDNDRKEIGQYSNPWSYGVNLRLQYKGLSLFILGVGQFGGELITDDNYFWVDGNDKYSEVVLGRWTPETANTATYPRLSSNTNNHNYRRSTFWMKDNSFFDIKRAQLTYEFGKDVCEKLGMSQFSINTAAINLFQFGESRDIRQLNIGSNPQYRTITFGLRTTF